MPGQPAFFRCGELTSRTAPERVKSIGKEAFGNCDKLTVCAEAGSFAAQYAKENGIRLREL